MSPNQSSSTSAAAVRAGRGQMAVLLAAVFAVMLGYGVTLTVLPYYTSRVHRLNGVSDDTLAVHIGILTGVYALAQLISGPLVGRLTDRRGRRPVAVAGLVAVGVTQIAFGTVTSLWWLYGLRVAGGVAAGLLTVAASAMIADWTDGRGRPRGMALFGTAVSLGIVAGPVLGGLLNGASIDVGGIRLDGYSLPFVAAGLIALLAAAFVEWRLAESRPEPASARGRPAGSATTLDRLGPSLALVTVAQFGLTLFESTFVLYARDRFAFTVAETTQAFLVCGGVMAVLQLVAAGPLRRVLPPLAQIAVGFLGMGAGIAALLAVQTSGAVLLSVGVLAAGTALITPNLAAVVSQASPRSVGASLGMKSSASSFGQFLGSVVGGTLLAWRAASPYALAAFLLGGSGVATALAARRTGRELGPGHMPPPAPTQ
jgi:DHA1 family multidrug resistance protein-like MFS transporter